LTASAFSNPEAVALKMVTLSYERSKEVSSDSKEPQDLFLRIIDYFLFDSVFIKNKLN
jgi:hypothetical protein